MTNFGAGSNGTLHHNLHISFRDEMWTDGKTASKLCIYFACKQYVIIFIIQNKLFMN